MNTLEEIHSKRKELETQIETLKKKRNRIQNKLERTASNDPKTNNLIKQRDQLTDKIKELDDQDLKLFMLTPDYLKIKNQSDGLINI